MLHNFPFHQLAQAHTELVCGMNLCMPDSFLAELDGLDLVHAVIDVAVLRRPQRAALTI